MCLGLAGRAALRLALPPVLVGGALQAFDQGALQC